MLLNCTGQCLTSLFYAFYTTLLYILTGDWVLPTSLAMIHVMEGSDFIEDYLVSIKFLQIFPTGLAKEDKGWFTLPIPHQNGTLDFYLFYDENTLMENTHRQKLFANIKSQWCYFA